MKKEKKMMLFFALFFLFIPLKLNAVNFIFFARPEKFENVLFSSPILDKEISLISRDRMWIFREAEEPIMVEIKEEPISRIVTLGDTYFLFCSKNSRLVILSSFGIERRILLKLPCIAPPAVLQQKIYIKDIGGNLCYIPVDKNKNDELECISLTDLGGGIEMMIMSQPSMAFFSGYVIVPHRDILFAVSENLRVKYPLINFRGNHILSLKVRADKMFVATQKAVYMYSLTKEGEAISAKKLFHLDTGSTVMGADFDGKIALITTIDGIISFIPSERKIIKKAIKNLFDISEPVLYRNNFFFIASFGRRQGNIFGPVKNSLIVGRIDEKISFEEEIIINSFARLIELSYVNRKIGFITEDGTIYVFRL